MASLRLVAFSKFDDLAARPIAAMQRIAGTLGAVNHLACDA
jgi:hypothetical protein